MKNSTQQVVITVFKIKAELVRQVASKYNYLYEERPVSGSEDLIKFFFKPLDSTNTHILAKALPTEIFAYKAIIDN